ncbi:MAG: hypothetical protein IPJ03_15400 [Ignavibacteriales bacterium]|nr:hypothetical protein [Ignavibacteriales bacterium]
MKTENPVLISSVKTTAAITKIYLSISMVVFAPIVLKPSAYQMPMLT